MQLLACVSTLIHLLSGSFAEEEACHRQRGLKIQLSEDAHSANRPKELGTKRLRLHNTHGTGTYSDEAYDMYLGMNSDPSGSNDSVSSGSNDSASSVSVGTPSSGLGDLDSMPFGAAAAGGVCETVPFIQSLLALRDNISLFTASIRPARNILLTGLRNGGGRGGEGRRGGHKGGGGGRGGGAGGRGGRSKGRGGDGSMSYPGRGGGRGNGRGGDGPMSYPGRGGGRGGGRGRGSPKGDGRGRGGGGGGRGGGRESGRRG